MAQTLQYTFPVASTSDVCASQSTVGAANLILNGNLAQSNQVSFISYGYSRSVSITTTANLIGRTITVTGTQNGVIITEDIAGVNNDTTYGTEIYDVITSIHIDGTATNISVGTGYLGFFPLIQVDLFRPVINYSLITARLTAVANSTIIYNTLDDIYQNNSTFLDNIANNHTIFSIKTISQDSQYSLPSTDIVVCNSILIQITGVSDTEIGDSIKVIFTQT